MKYAVFFENEDDARARCRMKNQASVKDIYALVDGPADDFAVVDLKTAIELGQGYEVLG